MNMSKKPKVIVFDLDYTLWPFFVDCAVTPPFRKERNGEIIDSRYRTVECYKEVPKVLEDLYASGYKLAIASKANKKHGAEQLIKLFGWDRYFIAKEIYNACKIDHFIRIQDKTKVSFREMLFFDDQIDNISDLRSIEVSCIWVKNGVTKKLVQDGLQRYCGL